MRKEHSLYINPELLVRDRQRLSNLYKLQTELKKLGFWKNEKIVFDDKDEAIIKDIFDKYNIPFKIETQII